MIDFLKTKSTITPDLSLFHEVQDITREHFNHSVNRANQFYIADMQIMKAENHGKPQDRSYKHRIFTNPVKILRFLNRTIWCDCYFNPTEVIEGGGGGGYLKKIHFLSQRSLGIMPYRVQNANKKHKRSGCTCTFVKKCFQRNGWIRMSEF